MTRPIVLCPLRHEMKTLRRICGRDAFAWICCGPGQAGIASFAATHRDALRPVILAGLAGGLSESFRSGSASIVTEVVEDGTSHRWQPTLLPPDRLPPKRCVATYAHATVVSIASKLALANRTGADLVDLESVAFARTAGAAGWPWAIVRGVSDDASQTLPPEVDGWVTPTGLLRIAGVVGSTFRRPLIVRDLLRLSRSSAAALAGLGSILDQF